MVLRVFLGYQVKKSKSVYAMSVYAEGCTGAPFPPQILHGTYTAHFVVLSALKYFVQQIASCGVEASDMQVDFYCYCDSVAFEWEEELLKDGVLSPETQDTELWNEIVEIVHSTHIDLRVKGKHTALELLNKNEGKRAGHAKQ